MKTPDHKVLRNNLIDGFISMVQEIQQVASDDPIGCSVCRIIESRLREEKAVFDPNEFIHGYPEVKHFSDIHYTIVAFIDDPAVSNRALFLAYRIKTYIGTMRVPLYGEYHYHEYDYRLVPPTFKLSINWSGDSRLDSYGPLRLADQADMERYGKAVLECHKWSEQLLQNELHKQLHSEK